ncbi:MAG: 3-phosphoshikimate 1-carboxyvinyltransferase [Candidatus Nitrosopumilus limneticus]|nr:3-phosphoshikimate 1-carboxyvinyltransferase [Candidatus Nitrosopumilus limneticus]MDC4213100.1 3-phosphoshikimate 1-carboxyvinyltransferase [Candidatus Nitrosopumilus limneticus]MDC4214217.1 3-phosphoshikimate 1-carboxyvinyltransferase [Candidatus Nitrosopumilus limneticus]MDC4215240.1 3-phosphoshikimate 1-carboxyvinyltransferase [Candidatus Nitrosopumilus limneticus]MDC4216501.1 3-phosphoshikimate 1-carboxyvinyltransferase [Candidatus Nitrosopumilus limneticus]
MNCSVEKSKIKGEINCPSNKSYTHRGIFLASLAGNNSKVENVLLSADTKATIEACKKFGAIIEVNNSSIIVKEAIKIGIKVPEIDTQNSGTTIRIAIGIASLFSEEITLTGDESIQKRPMQPLLDALSSIGARCSSNDGKPPVKIQGRISGGDVTIPGNLSSQFISSLLITAPLTKNGINLTIEGDLVSKPYLDATIVTMKKFGVSVQTLIPYKKYNITPQIYKNATFSVPIDFSSLALLLSFTVLNGEDIVIKGNIGNLPQGDEAFIDFLEQLGVSVTINENEIKVQSPEKLKGGKFDLRNSPDLLPPLAILSLISLKPIEIVNVKHARLKETDRIAILARELPKIGIKVLEKEDGLILESGGNLIGAKLDSENDHRLFMAFCIAGTYIGNCIVTDSKSVEVSYPNFIEEMNRLGAKIQRI